MEQSIFSATGRRKEATASVRMKHGRGSFTINNRVAAQYLMRETLMQKAQEPLEVTETLGQVDIVCNAGGGGLTGQAGAIRLAVARALVRMNPDLHPKLRKGGFLTRDPRSVERKKYGRPKARKRFQYSKR
ncbi:MAG: 30S ribosomal protein S9 [Candidatus Zixiibacteriota bacterium]